MEKQVTIIIPNYNGLSFMEMCFSSLKKQTCKAFEILVVDNGSSDGSVEWLRENKIPTIFLPENTGFTGAVNVGLRAAKTPYVILLNNDVEVTPRYVEHMLRAISRSKKIFSVSSKMIQLYHRERMDDAGDLYTLLGWAAQRGVGQPSDGYNRPVRIFSACAAAAIYRREIFEEIGYFDEMHFAYLEDLDVGYRAKIAGYDSIYCPDAVVYHVGSGTSGSKYNSFKVRLAARNNVYLNYKNMPLFQLLLNFPGIFTGIVIKYFFFKKRGFGKDYLEGFLEGVRTVHKCKKVEFRAEDVPNYAKIELELLAGTLVYVWEFAKRHTDVYSFLRKK
ncbi:MAG: glycosyltransferase family 2 protein [bacterium]|nr:glycosyltransferase family 2 protein [bacterium]